jgi:hypothetical protein
MPNRDDMRSQNQQNDMRQSSPRNERSDLSQKAIDKNKSTQQASSSQSSKWNSDDSADI